MCLPWDLAKDLLLKLYIKQQGNPYGFPCLQYEIGLIARINARYLCDGAQSLHLTSYVLYDDVRLVHYVRSQKTCAYGNRACYGAYVQRVGMSFSS